MLDQVSIPFERESVFRLAQENGLKVQHVFRVSIPFERESVFRLQLGSMSHDDLHKFQFPSSGKVCSDQYGLTKFLRHQ